MNKIYFSIDFNNEWKLIICLIKTGKKENINGTENGCTMWQMFIKKNIYHIYQKVRIINRK